MDSKSAGIHPYQLAASESVIRSDLVIQSESYRQVLHPVLRERLTLMVLTTEHIFFLRPIMPWYYPLLAYPGYAIMWWGLWGLHRPLVNPFQIRLSEIKRLARWRPEFSGPLEIRTGKQAWSVGLLTGKLPRVSSAPLEDVRHHFESVEDAWAAQRKQVGSP